MKHLFLVTSLVLLICAHATARRGVQSLLPSPDIRAAGPAGFGLLDMVSSCNCLNMIQDIAAGRKFALPAAQRYYLYLNFLTDIRPQFLMQFTVAAFAFRTWNCPDLAEKILIKAIRFHPAELSLYIDLGWFGYFQSGDYYRAIEVLTEAEKLPHCDPIVAKMLAAAEKALDTSSPQK